MVHLTLRGRIRSVPKNAFSRLTLLLVVLALVMSVGVTRAQEKQIQLTIWPGSYTPTRILPPTNPNQPPIHSRRCRHPFRACPHQAGQDPDETLGPSEQSRASWSVSSRSRIG